MKPVAALLGSPTLFVPGAATVEYDPTIARQEINFTGHSVEAMTINGQLSGPTLRFTEGDHAVIRVHNRMEVETSIHWHGIPVPNAMDGVPFLTYPPISPGEAFKPTPLHLRYAEELRNSFPEKVQSAARKPPDAIALVYAMLLSPDAVWRAKEITELDGRTAPGVGEKTAALWPEVGPIGADGLIQEQEAELLRAMDDTLDCPIPPFVETAES